MANYKSKYPELGFMVNGVMKRFSAGKFTSTTKAEDDVLAKLKDVEKLDEPKATPTKKAAPKKEA